MVKKHKVSSTFSGEMTVIAGGVPMMMQGKVVGAVGVTESLHQMPFSGTSFFVHSASVVALGLLLYKTFPNLDSGFDR